MAGQTKMIIITSDEDIIRQFSLNNSKNTHIIDLNIDNQVGSIEKDNKNTINLNFLNELSELNSNNDQIYKRSLDSSDHNRSKPVKTRKKSTDMICTICGDHAIGFNYDVPSCASCKAFFRRNANQTSEKIRCLTGQGQCSVAHEIRRKCPKCRLDRCFAMGMRKDFILTEEEKQIRKNRLEENRNLTLQRLSTSESGNSSSSTNRLSTSESPSPKFDNIDQFLMDLDKVEDSFILDKSIDDMLLEQLSIEDWVTIQSVQSSFVSYLRFPNAQCHKLNDLSDRDSALMTWSDFANQLALRFINFFRRIGEFESLHVDDRLILIKYNLLTLFPISKCYNYNATNNCWSSGNSEEAEKHQRFLTLCGISNAVRDSFINLTLSLVEITDQDPILLSLLLVILLFSQGLSMSEDEPPLKDPLAVTRAQSHYIEVLWNYMVNKQGETKTCKWFTQLLNMILVIQTAGKRTREFFIDQLKTSNNVDKIAPLLQTVLHIS